jgi:tetraacyldisaccharide 4'-kinase
MKVLRKILFPFSVLYGWITSLRNVLYDYGILKSESFSTPIIAVGNLSVGGTGKTPQIEYLIQLFSPNYKLAVLSRGYKRKSKGFLLANQSPSSETLGDESFQLYKKFPDVIVAVDANRRNGIKQLLALNNHPEIILLDDAFQHRSVKADFYILLTAYDDLFCDDFILPSGNLRESKNGAKRANMIIITKCPNELSELAQRKIKAKIKEYSNCPIFFSKIVYDDKVYSHHDAIEIEKVKSSPKLLVAGIAKPNYFFEYLNGHKEDTMVFPDHHHFSEKDYVEINKKAKGRILVTTEKDYVRMNSKYLSTPVYFLPIKTAFINEEDNLIKTLLDYVGTSSRNSSFY